MSKETPTPKPTKPKEYSAYAVTSYNIHDRSRGTIYTGKRGAFASTPEKAIRKLRQELGTEYDGLDFKTEPVKHVRLGGRFLK